MCVFLFFRAVGVVCDVQKEGEEDSHNTDVCGLLVNELGFGKEHDDASIKCLHQMPLSL